MGRWRVLLLFVFIVFGLMTDTTGLQAKYDYGLESTSTCDRLEHLQTHIHMHISLYIDSQPVHIPQSVGVSYYANKHCYYWLHTHNTSGILHIEAPAPHIFVLGNFLDIWEKHFNHGDYPVQLNKPGWQVYVNGKVYQGSLRLVPLNRHALITMFYHSPNIKPDIVFNWASNL